MSRPRLLDLFCGAGLAADGYAAAGWDVVGVDINPQPDYPYEFWQADALTVLRDEPQFVASFDAIHASPPCQFLTRAKHLRKAQGGESKYPDLLTPTLEFLRMFDIPWVVENVEGARDYMPTAARLCGSSFMLEVQRHRLFLSNVPIRGTECAHGVFPLDPVSGKPRPWGIYHVPGDSIPGGGRTARDATHAQELFGLTRELPWDSIKEGFPPVYTEHIGHQLRDAIAKEIAAEYAAPSPSEPSRCGCECHGPSIWAVCPHCQPDLFGAASEEEREPPEAQKSTADLALQRSKSRHAAWCFLPADHDGACDGDQ